MFSEVAEVPDAGRRRLLVAGGAGLLAALAGCSVSGTSPGAAVGPRRFVPESLIKTDFAHFVEMSQRRIFVSLRLLAEKLYRRNPREWRKSGAESVEEAVSVIFDVHHRWRFPSLHHRRDVEALLLAFDADFAGDRVQAFIVGMASMVQSAFGDNVAFYLANDLNAQSLYNAARNVEIAVWRLSTYRDENDVLLLLSNEMGEINNLSFEREFGRIVGTLEVLTDITEYKTERTVIRVVQNMATAVFLPIF